MSTIYWICRFLLLLYSNNEKETILKSKILLGSNYDKQWYYVTIWIECSRKNLKLEIYLGLDNTKKACTILWSWIQIKRHLSKQTFNLIPIFLSQLEHKNGCLGRFRLEIDMCVFVTVIYFLNIMIKKMLCIFWNWTYYNSNTNLYTKIL